MLRNYSLDVGDGGAGELKGVHSVLRKRLLQGVEPAGTEIAFQRIGSRQDLIEQLAVCGDFQSLHQAFEPSAKFIKVLFVEDDLLVGDAARFDEQDLLAADLLQPTALVLAEVRSLDFKNLRALKLLFRH